MPVYIDKDKVGQKLRQRDDDEKTITTILVSKEGEVNYGWVIYPREKNDVDNSILKHFSINTNLELYEFGALVGRDNLNMRTMINFMTEAGNIFVKFSNKKNISYFGLRYDLENGAKSPMLTILSKEVSDNLIVLFGSPSISDKGDYGRVGCYLIHSNKGIESGYTKIDDESFYVLTSPKDRGWKAAYEGYQTEVANMLKATPSENLTKTTTISKLQK
jgi:hypothetical protein